LFGIASRVAHDYRRRLQRKPAVSLDSDTQASADHGPFEHAATAQARRALERFLQSLDPDRRAVFVMAELEDMGAPEISQAVGARINTVYSRLRTARERFVAFLEAEGDPHG
jgi:RNA polymerase sigma-70 factor (ECF subfamily)